MPGKRRANSIKATDNENKEIIKETEHKTKVVKRTQTLTNDDEVVVEKEIMEEVVSTRTTRLRSKKLDNQVSDEKQESMEVEKSNKKRSVSKKAKNVEEEKVKEDQTPSEGLDVSQFAYNPKSNNSNKKVKPEQVKPTKTESKDNTPDKDGEAEVKSEDTPTKKKVAKSDNSRKPNKGLTKKLSRNRSLVEDILDDYVAPEQPLVLGDGKVPGSEILISSWNVASLNALLKKPNLIDYVKDRKPDILCLNETKLTDENFIEIGTKWIPEGYYSYFNNCKVRKGYSGTAIISKHKPISVVFDLGIRKHDLEGRTITLEFETFYVVACYVPNAGDKLVGLGYRTEEWDPDFRNYLNELRKKKHVVLCGDLNCAHNEIDIHRPKGNERSAGFTIEERNCFSQLLDSGFVDTFRHFNPTEQKFSYFSMRFGNFRAQNKGWRLDYVLVNKEGMVGVKNSFINEKVFGSDHLPVELVLNPEFKETQEIQETKETKEAQEAQ